MIVISFITISSKIIIIKLLSVVYISLFIRSPVTNELASFNLQDKSYTFNYIKI